MEKVNVAQLHNEGRREGQSCLRKYYTIDRQFTLNKDRSLRVISSI